MIRKRSDQESIWGEIEGERLEVRFASCCEVI